jgi:site-specific DNA recombinase
MPDGRTRRGTLRQKHREPPLYQKIADEVMRLYRQQMLLQDIVAQLGVSWDAVNSAVHWWHEVRGLPVPDGRARRIELPADASLKAASLASAEPAAMPAHESDDGHRPH